MHLGNPEISLQFLPIGKNNKKISVSFGLKKIPDSEDMQL